MNVASLERCRELYELSGWEETDSAYWPQFIDGTKVRLVDWNYPASGNQDRIPAYSLGYLLRKLPPMLDDGHPMNYLCIKPVPLSADAAWDAQYNAADPKPMTHWYYRQTAETPEDAAVMLAIDLFKAGILVR